MFHKKANLHLHTIYSDGIMTPRQILAAAKKRGFGIVAITDHNEIKGTLKAFDLAPEYEMIAYLGSELFFELNGRLTELLVYFKEKKDIVAFFNEFRTDHFVPRFNAFADLSAMVCRHNGACIAPHPFAHKGLLGHGVEGNFDGVEAANSFVGHYPNEQARNYVAENPEKYLYFGGADTHFFRSSLDAAYTELYSKEEINFDSFWENLVGKKKTITFKPIGDSLPKWKRFVQETWCFFKVLAFLTHQDLKYRKLHNYHNFTKHHKRPQNA